MGHRAMRWLRMSCSMRLPWHVCPQVTHVAVAKDPWQFTTLPIHVAQVSQRPSELAWRPVCRNGTHSAFCLCPLPGFDSFSRAFRVEGRP
jgi:hypothetical protein